MIITLTFYFEMNLIAAPSYFSIWSQNRVDDVKEKFKSDDEDEHYHNYYFDGGIAQLIFDTNKFYLSLYSKNQEN